MASGITVTDEVVAAYDEVKQKHLYKYVTFRVSNCETKIIVENKVKESTWEEFQASFPADAAYWSVYDFDYKNKEGQDRNKLILVSWCPDTIKIKAKMMHSSSSDALKKKCPATPIQANDRDELNFDEVRDKILKTSQFTKCPRSKHQFSLFILTMNLC
ncbi:cofilin-like [Branchiostoma floridae]|uniref:Cofilin-like n=1 Tax=Branchiostoma floridae TaxID=7739 RepID=A0A9J7MB79_BRAFL|nr:cofilin-like [Branchiostoma floridae]